MTQRMSVPEFSGNSWFGASVERQRADLRDFCSRNLQGRQLWLASNRGPYAWHECEGRLRAERGQGGLVSALLALVHQTPTPLHWVASAMTRADARVARQSGLKRSSAMPELPLQLSFVTPSRTQYARYYDAIANHILWFVQHNVGVSSSFPAFDEARWEAWLHGYVAVNRLFARHLTQAVQRSTEAPVFLVQDYHLYLLPGLLREAFPRAPIAHFTHIAWPGADLWRSLPAPIREAILTRLLGADLVGFHCPRYVQNFLDCCQVLLEVPVDRQRCAISWNGRQVKVRSFPISVDPSELSRMAESPEVRALEHSWLGDRPERLVAMIARTDPSKNLIRSLLAFETFLARHPDWQGSVQLLALLPLSRQSTSAYASHVEDLLHTAARINASWESPRWKPIDLHFAHDQAKAIALLKRYDVLIVNSVADGMNLVAKEGPCLNRRSGVLLLSECTGAAQELGPVARVVNPFDILGLAEAIHDGLCQPVEVRRHMIREQRAVIAQNTIHRWAKDHLRALLAPHEEPEHQTPFAQRHWAHFPE